jgi:hypothetical protein
MSNSRDYNISNEHLLLVSILNSMYNDNIRQINNLTESIHLLNDTNTHIRNLLIQMLYTPQTSTITNRRNILRQNSRTNNYRENLRRIFLNNTPYVIDNVQRYNIPSPRVERNHEWNNTTNANISQILQNFFQPIDIFPTQTQIEAATRTVRYGDIISPINRSCPISLENFDDSDIVTIIRFCGHIFNREELDTWFRSNCRCPVCRYDVRNYQANTSNNSNLDITHHTSPPTSTETTINSDVNEDTISDNNLQQNQSYENGTTINNQHINQNGYQSTLTNNTNNSIQPSIFFDIIIDNFNEENFRELLNVDHSGNSLFSILNRRLNDTYGYR